MTDIAGTARARLLDAAWELVERRLADLSLAPERISRVAALSNAFDFYRDAKSPRLLAEWEKPHGDVLWWAFPVREPPYCGTPMDDDFPDYVTHWTRFTVPASEGA